MPQTPFDNAAWAKAKPKLSVLIPFKGDDACALLRALDEEQAAAEIVILDDGSADPCLTSRVQATMAAMRLPVRLLTLATNEGRSKGRNRLAGHARAQALLFLDADMLPDNPDFLGRWIAVGDAPIAFGGFSLDRTPVRRETALNRAMANQTETLDAALQFAGAAPGVREHRLRRELHRLGLGRCRMGHARRQGLADPAYRQQRQSPRPGSGAGDGGQVRAVGRQFRPHGAGPPGPGRNLPDL